VSKLDNPAVSKAIFVLAGIGIAIAGFVFLSPKSAPNPNDPTVHAAHVNAVGSAFVTSYVNQAVADWAKKDKPLTLTDIMEYFPQISSLYTTGKHRATLVTVDQAPVYTITKDIIVASFLVDDKPSYCIVAIHFGKPSTNCF
jgi:hypothetical protein